MGPAQEAGIVSPRSLHMINICEPTSGVDILLTQNVPPSRAINFDPETLASLNDANLAWLHVHWPELGENIQCA